ncbi:MAG: FecR domain-containing protein [Caldilineales bacterium]|nr:FecR domain-containing protein [Caldilineales bacterium]
MTAAQPASNSPSSAAPSPYENVGRQAWVMLWIAFIILLALLIGTPLLLNWYLHNATDVRPTEVEAIRGTTLVIRSDSGGTVAVVDRNALAEGDLVRTDENARANVTIGDGENANLTLANVQLRSNSELLFEQARTPQFQISDLPEQVRLKLNLGQARVSGSSIGERPLDILVDTLHGNIKLHNGGDAAIAVTNDSTEVSARAGEVLVESQGQIINLSSGQRSTIAMGQPPTLPEAGPVNLVQNGDFMDPLNEGWEVQTVVDAGDPSTVESGTVTIVPSGDRRAAYFAREGEEGIHTETAIVQEINADVLDFDSLKLRMDVLLLNQSLPGGGQQSSEFPLMARIDFVDVDGNERFWTWGFYATDPVANWPIRDSEKIPYFVWYDYESPDFLNSPTFPRPQKVTRIRIYGSGHNYRSQVSGVGLIAQ